MIVVPLVIALIVRGLAANNNMTAMKNGMIALLFITVLTGIFRRSWYCAGVIHLNNLAIVQVKCYGKVNSDTIQHLSLNYKHIHLILDGAGKS
ncbi:hypothetical protein [Colwellia sp. MB02u-10]|uniref:hypothetical protein n=1 Tax=Colwellia sp. MB02u-10 TaxID=2759828 RepID=UPI0021753826|nr:hypothetical protein [Colwellia sp. MB02u-10]